ncbi:disulfide oxidoreductase [Bacillus sp. SA1-12]|uniref:YuzD family protein n=1 Tax=Bacillus sp. SA1-12 TaxID=1455638 RepID=UPI000625B274|nr:YuzD family protein [Bacillus sp. SA1-12]KKI93349.1 disulfide oxidoreductase [Bacillus sp. SA1-12]
MKPVEICVYGAEILCPSCVNLPSAKETYEWLDAALKRKYKDQHFTITYIDINQPPNDHEKQEMAEKVINDEYFYPLVVIEGTVVGEGNPRLKRIYEEMELHGYVSETV